MLSSKRYCRRRPLPMQRTIMSLAALSVLGSFRLSSSSVHVLASSPSYNDYQYDHTTPHFTPDGRLLQVEYASRAPERSGPLVVVPILTSNHGGGGEESIKNDADDGGVPNVILASFTESQQQQRATTENNDEDDDKAEIKQLKSQVNRMVKRGQSRLITLPLGPTVSSSAISAATTAPSVTLGLSGILADATSLLRVARDDLIIYQRTYGIGKLHAVLPTNDAGVGVSSAQASPTVVSRRVARAIADKCQINSFGGGIRPYGASIVICGIDESGACVCVTDPSGAIVARQFTAANLRDITSINDNSDNEAEDDDGVGSRINGVIVVGGEPSLQRKLKEQIRAKLASSASTDRVVTTVSSRLRHGIDAVVEALLETHGYLGQNAISSEKGWDRNGISLEVTIARSDGTYRLSDRQIDAIVSRIMKQS